jgi:thiol:disulfide interchange protein DsbA
MLPHSKLYYSLVSLGLEEKLTLAVYNEIHQKKNYLLSEHDQADFLATQGVDKRKFIDAYYSFTVMSLMEQGDKLIGDYYNDIHSDTIPTLVVAGRYKTGPSYTKSYDGTAPVLDYLVKQVLDNKL